MRLNSFLFSFYNKFDKRKKMTPNDVKEMRKILFDDDSIEEDSFGFKRTRNTSQVQRG